MHCEVIYDTDSRQYSLLDRGSNFSTTINGITLAKFWFSIILSNESDDLALLSHTHEQMKIKTASVAAVSVSVDLNIQKGKIKVFKYNTENINPTALDGETLEDVESFTYLGSSIDEKGGSNADVKARIGKPRTTFLQLKNIWNSKQLSTNIKLRIFNTNVKAVLLYGAETWRTTTTIIKKCKSSILRHGDIIRLGSTRLLVHIHNGNETCGQCDPDEIKAALTSIIDVNETNSSTNDDMNTENLTETIPTHSSKDAERRAKLDEIKKKYGLKFPRIRPQAKTDRQYMDRAAQRRAIEANLKAAGYPLPPAPGVIKQQLIKTPLITRATPASVYKPIGDENKGAKLLAKMGWTPGQGLGKSKTGISEPITVSLRVNPQAGLGSSSLSNNTIPIDSTPRELSQAYIRAKTKERFDKLS
ncbi:unnamed protein product [Schistosoma mattheei]|uniref:G-patch domain-containing protein n=1 Tax=Schistosoma mattheei TaxID=31246 RepID=A0A3P8F9K4_9TREM|nr:unnamed protein product [Schistosoma mattheei]